MVLGVETATLWDQMCPRCDWLVIAESMEELTGQLGETGNQSATRGYRTTEPARIAGEGELASFLSRVSHQKNHA